MNAGERRAAWRSLALIEDWLRGGIRVERAEPDFEAAPLAIGGQPRAGDSLEAVAAEVDACRLCPLGEARARAVAGQGVASPLVMVIGEGPGAEEDAQGLPFVGPAGKLLDKMLAAVKLSRDRNCFITNVVKCRPPGNRDPAPGEQAACSAYLQRQIALLAPKVILCVGRVAAQSLLGTKEGIGSLRGRWLRYAGLPLIATFHPSALLRDESLKRPAWEDLKVLKNFLTELEGGGNREPPRADG